MTGTRTPIVATSGIEPVRWHVEEGRILLRAEDTGEVFSMMEFITPPGGGPRPHTHERESETFYVLDGEYEIVLGDRTVRAEQGAFAYGPDSVPHGFRNIGSTPARMLCVFTPGGVEGMFEGLADLFASGGAVDPAAIGALTNSFGVSSRRATP
jgi:quercetin dioxygenase-like cupin family protein